MRPGGGSLGPDKQPARIAGMFDAIAPRYDLLNHVLSGGLDLRWRARAVRSLALRGGETVLDLCTGTADLAIASATASPGAAAVVGVDFAGEMLRLGLDKVSRRGLARRIRLVRGDAMRIPLADASVDAATVAFGIRSWSSAYPGCPGSGRATSSTSVTSCRASGRSCPATTRRMPISPRQSARFQSRNG